MSLGAMSIRELLTIIVAVTAAIVAGILLILAVDLAVNWLITR